MNILDVIDIHEKIVGQESRKKIHQNGLLHREINVWFYTPKGDVLFQRRGPKAFFPNMLDATVGGHVEQGFNWLDTAAKEVQEETGLSVDKDDLHFLAQIHINAYDQASDTRNHALQNVYAYKFIGDIDDLKVEPDKAVGFEKHHVDELFMMSEETQRGFTFFWLKPYYPALFGDIKGLLK